VVSPEQEAVYRQFLSGDSARYGAALQRRAELHAAYEALQRLNACITLIVQPQPYGFGHAVWCARDFAQGEPVLVMLGDHIPLATGSVSPVQQALSMYERLRAPLYAVYRVPLHAVERYGILRGKPTEEARVYRLQQVVEKPTQAFAQQALRTPGLPEGEFFTHFGIYCMPAALWRVQAEIARDYQPGRGEWYLVDAQQRLLERMPAYLLEVEGKMLDFGTPTEYALAFRTLMGQ
jgi:UTP--glucose-1-phosphate uridylyltransferase